jgi:hypothetical protein
MARGLFSHSGGTFDRSEMQDIIDTDPFQGPITVLSGTADVIQPHISGNYVVNTGSADGITLTAPTSGVDDGVGINIVSNTAYAHTLTATGLLQTGASGTGVLTMAADAGCTICLRAYQGKWQLVGSVGITVTS